MILSELMTQVRGLTYSKKDSTDEYEEGKIAVLRAGNIYESQLLEKDYVFVPKNLVKEKQYLKRGDILIAASSGSIEVVGKAAMVTKNMDASFGAFCKVLRPDKAKVDLHYFKHFFETDYYKRTIKSLAEGANINNLKSEHFDNLNIPLPPLEEQKKIGAILDAADVYRQKTKALIEKYHQLTQSLFMDMFGDPVTNPKGWDYRKLSDISRYFIGLTYKPENVHSKGIIVLRSSNVQDFKLSFDDIVRVSLGVKEKLLVKPNDILMCTRNGSAKLVGKVALIGHEEEPMTFGAFMTIIRSDYYMYLMSYFKSPGFRRQIVTGATTTVNQITKNMLDRVELPLPPMRFQEHFAEKVAQIENQKQQAEASLVKAEELFNSLLQRAFKGELTN